MNQNPQTGQCTWPPCPHAGMTQDPNTGACSWPPCTKQGQVQDPNTGACSYPPCTTAGQVRNQDTGACAWPPCQNATDTQDPQTGKCTPKQAPICDPVSEGGSPPSKGSAIITKPVYDLGVQISGASEQATPLGDGVQELACSVNAATGL